MPWAGQGAAQDDISSLSFPGSRKKQQLWAFDLWISSQCVGYTTAAALQGHQSALAAIGPRQLSCRRLQVLPVLRSISSAALPALKVNTDSSGIIISVKVWLHGQAHQP